MGNLTIALVFVMFVNVLLFLTQAAILDINPEGTDFYNEEGSLLENFDMGDHVLDTSKITDEMPASEGSISPTTGNLFTDMFSSIKNWFARSTGLGYIYQILSSPYNILKSMNLPNDFVYAIGSLWYGITLFLIVSFFWGRTQ